MKTSPLLSQSSFHVLGAALLAAGIAVAQEKPAAPAVVPDTDQVIDELRAEAESRVAYIDAKDKAEARIRKAERKRAKLIFSEAKAKGVVLAYAIPQPDAAEIESFMAPLKNFIATTKSETTRGWAQEQIVTLTRHYGFEKGRLRAVYVLIPLDKEQPLTRASFPAETEAECEKFIREDLQPVKWEIGKPHKARDGTRAAFWEINHGWDGQELVKDQGLEDMLENWVDWHRKRKPLK
ncbi:hypothetical protein [Haloferula sp. BvORR071]|uniref:hypothetical protein n=1 Tax=Haloferula sp. BvORR071 TaxID=1396141 RepID=UPI0005529A25|nr:hypothetical protein [Haloferula sp. BvORR071]